jgi:exonuclease III
MKEEIIKKLLEKYKKGETSLIEEQELFNDKNATQLEIGSLSHFIKNNQIKTPKNLNEKLWDSFENKQSKNNRFRIVGYAAAASILLVFSLYFGSLEKDKMTYHEKLVVLNEAKSMFENQSQEEIKQHIILETDLIIVYTSNK